jgi:hypothetical protein
MVALLPSKPDSENSQAWCQRVVEEHQGSPVLEDTRLDVLGCEHMALQYDVSGADLLTFVILLWGLSAVSPSETEGSLVS